MESLIYIRIDLFPFHVLNLKRIEKFFTSISVLAPKFIFLTTTIHLVWWSSSYVNFNKKKNIYLELPVFDQPLIRTADNTYVFLQLGIEQTCAFVKN